MKTNQSYQRLLYVPAIVGFVIVCLAGFLDLQTPQQRWQAGILLAIFAFFFFAPLSKKHIAPIWEHLNLVVLTACIAGLMLVRPGWGVFPILFFLLGPTVTMTFSLRTALIWIGIFTAVMLLMILSTSDVLNGITSWLVYSAGNLFFAMFGYAMSRANQDRKRSLELLGQLQEAHQKLQEYTTQLEELTIAQERNRIAREMHDTLGHRLTIAAVQLEGAQRLVRKDPERAETMIATVREQVKEGLGELRRTVAMLRASLEEELPIGQALDKLCRQTEEATGLHIHLAVSEQIPDLTPAYRHALYRAAQEGLTNIQRHAQARDAWLQLYCRDTQIILLVGDNGVGMDQVAAPDGYGLSGLRERAALLGGECQIDPRAGGGTQLAFRLPLQALIRDDHGCE
jgi:signal transduction histidine kinase